MFELAVRYLGDDEQVAHWLPQILACKIIGNYSQTELGHGSNVRVRNLCDDVAYLGSGDDSNV